MFSLVVTGLVSFFLLPKKPQHYVIFALAALFVIRAAGSQVMQRFETTFDRMEALDGSAKERLKPWGECWDLMLKHPLGVGADQFQVVVFDYGFERPKLAHSLWLQLGAELGFIGLACIVLFYGICAVRLWPLTREKGVVPDPWLHTAARIVIASLVGFAVSAQFVSLTMLEVPFYVTLIGAVALKLCSVPTPGPPEAEVPSPHGV
jgi:O-antigen ligase